MKQLKKEDFKPLNFESILSTLNGCKVFSVVEMSNCYWHQKLTEESTKWLKNILAIFQVHYQFSMISSFEVEMNKNMI